MVGWLAGRGFPWFSVCPCCWVAALELHVGCWLCLVCGYLFWVVAHVSDLLVWGLGLLFLIGGLREFRLVLVYLDLLGFWVL